MLKTETYTQSMGKRVASAARVYFHTRTVYPFFEHGQWWIELKDGSQYSVNDAEGGGSVNGFCFDMVTSPQE
jgi:hypothetical protein